MVDINEVIDEELITRIEDHKSRGGALSISVFKIKPGHQDNILTETMAHLITARESLEKQNFVHNFFVNRVQGSRNDNYTAITNHELLETSAKCITLAEFLGPYFDIDKNKPIVRGVRKGPTYGHYFYFDDDEVEKNILNIEDERKAFWDANPNNAGGLIYALSEPPYPMKIGENIEERGRYILEFMTYFFNDIRKLQVFSWSTKSSNIFDIGNDWWGSFFYTVYNPIKDWYIGIIASTSD